MDELEEQMLRAQQLEEEDAEEADADAAAEQDGDAAEVVAEQNDQDEFLLPEHNGDDDE